LTALRNGSGNLELISWHTDPQDNVVTRGADSGTLAGTANEVALAIIGRTAITAVRSGSNNLLLISWDVPPGLTTINRLHDSGTAAGEASNIAITTVGTDLVVTAVRNGSGNLELISWRLEPDQTLSRLSDSGSHAGAVSWVTIAAIDSSNVVTAVRNGSGNLEVRRRRSLEDRKGRARRNMAIRITGYRRPFDRLATDNRRRSAWRRRPAFACARRDGMAYAMPLSLKSPGAVNLLTRSLQISHVLISPASIVGMQRIQHYHRQVGPFVNSALSVKRKAHF
jgi:hypothetical protein